MACEWDRAPAMRGGQDPEVHLPRTCKFFRVVNDTLRWFKGINPLAPRLKRCIDQSGYFEEALQIRFEMPIGGDALGVCYRSILGMYAESMRLMLLEAGQLGESEVAELVMGYMHEVHTVPGMVSIYHAVHARKI